VIYFDSGREQNYNEISRKNKNVATGNFSSADEILGKLGKGNELYNSVIEDEEEAVSNAKLLKDALNQGISAFTPSSILDQLVKNFSIAKNLFGETLLMEITGYDIKNLERDIKIPEFQREVNSNILKNIEKLKQKKLLSEDGSITDTGKMFSAILLFKEEIDKLVSKGFYGEKVNKQFTHYGDKDDVKIFKKGDRYRDIAIKSSAKLAIRRGHDSLHVKDMRSFERQRKGSIYVVYALDASSSMKGKKLEMCKKAGIALVYKALESGDKVGLMVFGSDVRNSVNPTDDFPRLIYEISKIRAVEETNISETIKRAVEFFPNEDVTKHLIVITDAMPNIGDNPEEDTLEAVSTVRSSGITVSVVGVKLNAKAKKLAEKIASIGEGRFYVMKDLENIDMVVLEDYYEL